MLKVLVLILVRIQYYLLLVLGFIVPVALLYFGYRGVMYWVDVWERPQAQKQVTLYLDGLGDVKVFYPRSIRLNTSGAAEIELEFEPLQPASHADMLTLAFDESSDYIKLVPEAVEIPLSASTTSSPPIDIETRDLDRPPAGVDIIVTATETESGLSEQQTVRLTIDNTLWRIVAAFAVVSALVAFLGSAFALLRLR